MAILFVVAAMSIGFGTAHAGPCGGYVGGGYGLVPVLSSAPGVFDVAGLFYVDVREVAGEDYDANIWIYEETNGQFGLQRGGPGDPCVESAIPDTVVY